MSSFTKPLFVEVEQRESHGRGMLTLIQEFEYHVGYLGSNEVITVPVGFKTDGCSIPSYLRWWLPVLGRVAKAGVVHDYILYKKLYDQKRAADIFLEALTILEAPPIQAKIMYLAVKYWPWISDVEQ